MSNLSSSISKLKAVANSKPSGTDKDKSCCCSGVRLTRVSSVNAPGANMTNAPSLPETIPPFSSTIAAPVSGSSTNTGIVADASP